VLTSELILKSIYAKIMKMGSQNMYGDIPTTTVIVTDKLTSKMKTDSTIKVLESLKTEVLYWKYPAILLLKLLF